jgi:hypothetical protein
MCLFPYTYEPDDHLDRNMKCDYWHKLINFLFNILFYTNQTHVYCVMLQQLLNIHIAWQEMVFYIQLFLVRLSIFSSSRVVD